MATTRWLCVFIFAVSGLPLLAQNQFTVTTVADSGAGSLRQAIIDANALPNQVVSMVSVPDEIRFQSGVTGTITLATSLPQVTEGLSIIGPGRTLLTVSGANSFRIFESALGTYMGVSRMTLANGRGDGDGGAIYSRGWTVLFDLRIENSHAVGASSGSGPGVDARGGGIYHEPLIANLDFTNGIIASCDASGGDGTTMGGHAMGGAVYVAQGAGNFWQVTFDTCISLGGDATTAGAGGNGTGGAVYGARPLSFTDCVFSNCMASGGSGAGASGNGGWAGGGGVFSERDVTMLRVTITSCGANGAIGSGTGVDGDGFGGGVFFSNATATALASFTLLDIDLCGNSAGASGATSGGGIHSQGALSITESVIRNCANAVSSGGSRGAGVRHDAGGTVQIQRSTFSGNNGEGIDVTNSASVVIINSTISGNTGGGLRIATSAVQVSFSTITANSGQPGIVRSSTGTITIIGSIVAGNTASPIPDINASGSMSIQDSVVGVQDPDAIAVNGVNGNQVGSVGTPLMAMLGPLTNNGGPTPTHALLTGSPAINMGGATGVPSTDQRNAVRDQGVADAGSYEFGATPANTGGNAGGEGDARCSTSAGGFNWLALLGLLATLGLVVRLRRA